MREAQLRLPGAGATSVRWSRSRRIQSPCLNPWAEGSPPTGARSGENGEGGHGVVSPGVILVPLVQRSPGLTQLFSFIASSHSVSGIPEGFWEHTQGKGNRGGLEKPVRERERKTVTKRGGEVAFPIGEPKCCQPLLSRWNLRPPPSADP